MVGLQLSKRGFQLIDGGLEPRLLGQRAAVAIHRPLKLPKREELLAAEFVDQRRGNARFWQVVHAFTLRVLIRRRSQFARGGTRGADSGVLAFGRVCPK
ncbi:hypothetical protein Ari01nite_94190 [Paractinoplanes rishiriensis]|uniref:Uncharacterized protein n=1 Tax=Paractinoplanes rishiriensis TaxID=1050105 RepID=A0A919K905_9ACTN|nr:hypothetical protein Ari01nite_94190 [Actinoplanes rishiriensis]